jgi:myo-inositol 2-dehydrogenase / D-chiro-inositol 1-dehydrogenase
MPAQSLKVGLIGAGRIGRLHAEHLTSRIPSVDLLIVADVYPEAARECAERYAIPAYTHDYREVLSHPAVQAAIVCSSTATHAQIIKEAARAGKHIFCEKPIALDLPSIDEALRAVELAGVKLHIGFNRRFDASYRRVWQAVKDGEIGQPLVIHITSRDPAPPPLEYLRVSGGIFLDMTIHDFDMARFLIGSEIVEVSAIASAIDYPDIAAVGDVSHAVVTLHFANGVIGTISNSRAAVYGYDQRVEVLGSAGAISIDNNYPNTALISDAHSVRRDLPLYFFIERYTESFVSELAAFVDAIRSGAPVPVTGYDGRAPVAVALAAQKSLIERRLVRLDEIDDT